ncbi:hypothetical protein H6P81_005482 [Aristolochia fimbriata]|uniref:Pentatricopeptide repeat-containing protein n=1 Tax=Aristolochia fimbriata TaxID=158543 RepID=A0AAV7EV31_ARIFI|nr:hypothetical protein H6P81_005482 [Aristolochia fimbriata]
MKVQLSSLFKHARQASSPASYAKPVKVPSNVRSSVPSEVSPGTAGLQNSIALFREELLTTPLPSVYKFNSMLKAISKSKHHLVVVSLCRQMHSSGGSLDFYTLNILLTSFSQLGYASYAFAVFGGILKWGHSPDVLTFTLLNQALCVEDDTGS